MIETLKKIIPKISDLNYCLIGTLGLQLHGIDTKARDIDILIDDEGIREISKRLKEFQTKEIYYDESDGRNSLRSFYKIDNIEIEVLCNINNTCRPKDELEKAEILEFNGLKIRCASLESELIAYEKMGRIDKIDLIIKHLNLSS